MRDRISAKGTVTFKIYENGKLIEDSVMNNLIVTVGKTQMAHLLAGDTVGNFVVNIACGTNATATALGDTAITGAVSLPLGTITYPAAGSVKWDWTFGTGDANGLTVVEFGLLCGDGTLFSRITRPAITKTSAISIVGTWQIDW